MIGDWTRVEAGIFHAFHHGWITELGRTLNRGSRFTVRLVGVTP